MPTFGSLFAGIGGIDLGLERAGWECRWQVEWDGFCQNGLAKQWPDVERHGDITTVDWATVEQVDLLVGGFPCQPFSVAGRRKAQEDERWLWPEFARAIRDLRPRYALMENVPGLLGVNGGSAMGEVLGDLAALGYDTEWDCIPAAAVGALHERDRVFIVAHAASGGRPRSGAGDEGRDAPAAWSQRAEPARGGPARRATDTAHSGSRSSLAHADSEGLEGRQVQRERAGEWAAGQGGVADAGGSRRDGFAGLQGQQKTGRGRAGEGGQNMADPDGVGWDWGSGFFGEGWRRQLADSGGWEPEPAVGRLVDGLPRGLAGWRVAALKAYGNAVVPQVAEVIGRRLLEVMQP